MTADRRVKSLAFWRRRRAALLDKVAALPLNSAPLDSPARALVDAAIAVDGLERRLEVDL